MENTETKQLTIFERLWRAQQEFKPAIKDAENPFFKSSYADLSGVWEACREALHKNGLFVSQQLGIKDTFVAPSTALNTLKTVIYDVDGHKIESEMVIQQKEANNMQSLGSGITYARRYALASILGIITEDDDGNASVGGQESSKAPRMPYNKPKTQNVPSTVSEVENTKEPAKQVESGTPRYAETTAGKSAVKAYFGYASQLAIPQEKAKNDVKTKYGLKSFMDISKEQLTAENTRMKKLTSDNQKIDVDEISKAIPNAEFDSYLEGK